MKRKHFLSLLICAALITVLLPATAQATAHTINAGGTYDLATLGIVGGDTIDISAGLTVTLVGDAATTYTNVHIGCAAGVNLTLSDVKIDNSSNNEVYAISFTGAGNTLTLLGNNVMKSGRSRPGVSVGGTDLTISGTGSLSVTGGQGAPGIGGVASSYTVNISGGTVTANGGQGAPGIGGVISSFGTVNISGGTVTATGGTYAAGIGGGSSLSGGTANISGGTVTAKGGYFGAGIGGGWGGNGGTITISGGTVTATGGGCGAGIGSGNGQSSLPYGGTITINGGTVTATGGNYSAGIGGGSWYSNATNSYSGGNYSGTVYISGGSINATGKNAQRIGAGYPSINNGTLKTASGGADVYLTTVMLYNAPANTSVTALSTSSVYGINNMYTGTAGKLYLYLPEGTVTTSATVTSVYSGSITTTADHASAGILLASGDTYTLSAPTGLAWDTTTPGKATWDPVAYASSYRVQLYKDAAIHGSAITGVTGAEYDFTSVITSAGSYTFTVTAIGNGSSIVDSVESSISTAYVVLENVTFAASQTGGTSGTIDSTGILLTFSQSVTGLTADKVVITNGTGSITNGTLSGSGATYMIALTAVAAEGNVTVSIADFGNFHVANNPQTVSVYKADTTAPVLSSGSVNRTSDTTATIGFTTDEAGTAYYTVVNSGAAAPANTDIASGGTSLGTVSGTVANKAVTLSAGAKDIYLVVSDARGNISNPLKIEAAAYTAPTYTITASAGFGGSISPSGAVSIAAGGSQTFTITPSSNYSIASVTVDGVNRGVIASYTFSSVTDAHTIMAAFSYTGGSGTGAYYPRTLIHNPTGITVTGYIESGAALTVTDPVLGNDANDTLLRQRIRDNRYAFILSKDISISGGYSGSLTISIPVGAKYNGQTVTVLHAKNNGTLSTYSAVVTNGNAVFTVTSLSPFAVFTSSSVSVPNTGEYGFSFGFIPLALGLTSLLIWLRRSKAGKRLWF
jgi:hypothetical protein